MMVKEELSKLGLHYSEVDLGVVDIKENISNDQREQLRTNLQHSGLELLDDKRTILIERIKNIVIETVHYSDEVPKVNYSDLISEKLGYDYTYLANIFSEVKGITIQQFIIIKRTDEWVTPFREPRRGDSYSLQQYLHRQSHLHPNRTTILLTGCKLL
jgi:hypothetical protein